MEEDLLEGLRYFVNYLHQLRVPSLQYLYLPTFSDNSNTMTANKASTSELDSVPAQLAPGTLAVGLPPQTQVQGAVPQLSHSVILSLRLCLLTDLSSPWEPVSPWMTLHQGWYVLCPGPVLPNLDFSYP